jgi:hypothetical protein
VLGVDRGGFCMVDGDDLVLRNIVFRARSDLQDVVVCHASFVFKFGFSMLDFLIVHVDVTRGQLLGNA